MSPATAAVVGPGGDYQPDWEVSDVDDPDLGAASLEDNAVGGGDGAGGSEEGGGVETWPHNDEEDEPFPAWGTVNTGTGPSTESSALPPPPVVSSARAAAPKPGSPRSLTALSGW